MITDLSYSLPRIELFFLFSYHRRHCHNNRLKKLLIKDEANVGEDIYYEVEIISGSHCLEINGKDFNAIIAKSLERAKNFGLKSIRI